MPYSQPFVRFKMTGHFGSSATVKSEIWSAGLNIAAPAGLAPGGSTILSFLTAVAPAVTALHTNSTIAAGNKCWLDGLTGALIAVNGRYAGGSSQATTVYTYGSPSPGLGTPTGPWSQAMAWSLRSAILRGPGSHGRCFYPATALAPDLNTGALGASTQTAYAAVVVTLLNAVNTAATAAFGANTNVSNVSQLGLGFQSPVTRVGIGARLDSQESRENKTSEAYQFATTTIARAVLDQAEKDYLDLLEDELKLSRP